jgi:hypothetical protein
MWSSLFKVLALGLCASALPVDSPVEETSLSTRQTSGTLPNSFQWSSSGVLIAPKNDGRGAYSVKDPTVVYYNGKYHVFASIFTTGYNMIYTSFSDFSQASSAPFSYLGDGAIGNGYRAAPQVFYFAPQKLWYLVYQNGNAAYSTNPDIANPRGWTAPKNFYPNGQPSIITQNIGKGNWVDMWVICDSTTCHLFSSDDNGHLYRSATSLSSFPNGFTNTVIALSDSNPYALFEAANVYKLANAPSSRQYLLIVEAIGSKGRYFRSWTAASLSGTWTPLAASESNPFAGAANVQFQGTPWTTSISHGEVVRTNVDQTLTISPCKLRYLYQGINPGSTGGNYDQQPWRLGLLTQTNSPC